MSIYKISNFNNINKSLVNKPNEVKNMEKSSALSTDNSDKFIKSRDNFTPSYTKATESKKNAITDGNNARRYISNERDIASYKQLVSKLVLKQSGLSETPNKRMSLADIVGEQIIGNNPTRKPSMISVKLIDPSDFQPKPVKPSTGAEGYWSASNTAERLMDFAKTLSGGDISKISSLKKAVTEGLVDAENKNGGKGSLAKVSYDTYDKLLGKFEDWQIQLNNIR